MKNINIDIKTLYMSYIESLKYILLSFRISWNISQNTKKFKTNTKPVAYWLIYSMWPFNNEYNSKYKHDGHHDWDNCTGTFTLFLSLIHLKY